PVVLASDVDLPAQIMSSKESVLEDADGLIIMTDWDEFVGFDPDILRSSMRRPVVIDCVGVMEAKPSRLAGIEYISTGRRPLK
ncbi:MAG: hypothetical protein HYV01_17555, partial [Deltaproteobacteria bacterium]|nr:hypothetical protein [Deltaproteobacteria bacterium]